MEGSLMRVGEVTVQVKHGSTAMINGDFLFVKLRRK
ncbi:hypothetical protein PPTG_24939 [Phytophthora nicotianae INRA-310]|uniref:Uncharacterized protein n=1 Tax=Phytophthora nicotianae (strain INRA-310) TaxID=761204 RepID=W2P8Y0_PHYN3|nr:hypothetical protein PPTG_24939 [Phytophthora nicotianae INRA-310]ETM97477.1 hypothetical protein PPTG_24939 [Phytophthora nicotianae INRA-310]